MSLPIDEASRANKCSSYCQLYPRVKSLDVVPSCVSNRFRRPRNMISTLQLYIGLIYNCIYNYPMYAKQSLRLLASEKLRNVLQVWPG